MCIRDRYQRRVRGFRLTSSMAQHLFRISLVAVLALALCSPSFAEDSGDDDIQNFIHSLAREAGEAYNVAAQAATKALKAVSYTHLRAHETVLDLVCRLLLEKKKKKTV
eukprot:TRINITY_DN7497_c0_g1_i1.p1 TRINITY_DN7497_c0_g1~~TRINITY_DN7497_c0_g1_i1.p1  ORF type:complete len:109 (+),score=59.66 TRINITY_DN7497_c0_g1_i1:139-465(+)